MGDADLIVIDPIDLERIAKEVLLEFPVHRAPAELLRRCTEKRPAITAAERRRARADIDAAIRKRTG